LKVKLIQDAENAVVDAVIDAAASLNITPLQRVKFAAAIADVVIEAIAPYVQQERQEGPSVVVAKPKRVRVRPSRAKKAAVAATQEQPELPHIAPKAPDVTQPAKPNQFSGPPAVAAPFAG